MKITLELAPEEAHLLLPAISARRLEWSQVAADALDMPTREYGDVASRILARVETRICDQMFPEPDNAHLVAP